MSLAALPSSIEQQIRAHAAQFPDREVCGFIVNDRAFGWSVVPTENIHQEPKNNFAIADDEYDLADRRGIIIAIYHSHVNGNPTFSVPDIKASRSLQIPYVLVTKELAIKVYDPTTISPYVGRQWCWVSSNCFTLFQDYFRQELGHVIPDFYPTRDKSWLRRDVGYLKNLPLCGFRQLESEEPIVNHDVVLMTLGLKHPNHIGVIADVNTGKMLHHLADQLSEAIVFAPGNDYYKSKHSIWRLV